MLPPVKLENWCNTFLPPGFFKKNCGIENLAKFPEKIEKIVNFPTLGKQKKFQSFVGKKKRCLPP
jgi:hypothetical protein